MLDHPFGDAAHFNRWTIYILEESDMSMDPIQGAFISDSIVCLVTGS